MKSPWSLECRMKEESVKEDYSSPREKACFCARLCAGTTRGITSSMLVLVNIDYIIAKIGFYLGLSKVHSK